VLRKLYINHEGHKGHEENNNAVELFIIY